MIRTNITKTWILAGVAMSAFMFSIAPASAQITYVYAVEGDTGNTYEVGGSLTNTSWLRDAGGAPEDEDQWQKRTDMTWQNGDPELMAYHMESEFT